jgi:hypothetical protein
MDRDLTEFWQTTWKAWKGGALSELTDTYSNCANSFDEFITSDPVKEPVLGQFFSMNKPNPDEFLVRYMISGKKPTLVLTSQRLWMFDKQGQQHVNFELAGIEDFEGKEKLNSLSIKIRFTDGVVRDLEKIKFFPTDNFLYIRFAVSRSKHANGWQAAASEVPLKLLQKYVGDAPASLVSFVYWGVTKQDKSASSAVKIGVGAAVLQTVGAGVIGSQLGAGALFNKQDTYSGNVGLLAVAGEQLYFVSFGEIPFGGEIPSLTADDLKIFTDLPEPVVNKVPLSDAWCSVYDKSGRDNVILFSGLPDWQVFLLKSYPAEVIGAVTSAKQFVSSFNSFGSVAAPEKFLDMLASGAEFERAWVDRFFKDSSYMKRLLYLIVHLSRAKREEVIQGLGRFPIEPRSEIVAFLRGEAKARGKDTLYGWLLLLGSPAAFGTVWLMVHFDNYIDSLPNPLVVISYILIAILVLFGAFSPIVGIGTLIACYRSGWGSEGWLKRTANAIENATADGHTDGKQT